MRPISRTVRLASGIVALVTGVLAYHHLAPPRAEDANKASAASRKQNAFPWAQAGSVDAAPASLSNAAPRSADTLREVLYKGSFAGTHPYGDWCVSPLHKLQPCPLLRDRFEYYINGLGEINQTELRLLIEDEARRALGESLARDIIAIFDKYWAVRTHAYDERLVPQDRTTWMPALREQRRIREALLGEQWAKVFFDEDDQELLATFAKVESGRPPPPGPRDTPPLMSPGKDPSAVQTERVTRYGEAAAAKLADLDRQQAAFDSQIAMARSEWIRLTHDVQLSDPERDKQLTQYIASHFDKENWRRATVLAKLAAS